MGFGIGFTPQRYDAQFGISINNERRLALANEVNPNKITNVAAEDKQLALANVVNFSNEQAYENWDEGNNKKIGTWAASFGGIHFDAQA